LTSYQVNLRKIVWNQIKAVFFTWQQLVCVIYSSATWLDRWSWRMRGICHAGRLKPTAEPLCNIP